MQVVDFAFQVQLQRAQFANLHLLTISIIITPLYEAPPTYLLSIP